MIELSTFCMGCMEKIEDDVIICPHCGYDNNSTKENPLHIDPGEILRERYIVGKPIGYGGFGVTYIGWDALLEHKIAIKEYMPSEFSTRALGTKEVTVFGGKKSDQFNCGLERFHNEAKMLAKYNSEEGIVSVYDSFEENKTAYIVMELLDGVSLSEHLKSEPKMPYDKAIRLLLPIIESLETIHEQGVLHRDIAPDNLILTKKGTLKLIDFGASRYVTSSQHSMSVLIKPGFTPEEQYSSHGEQGPYTDVYSLGAVLYRMITGELIPDSLERGAYYEKHKKDLLTPISHYVKDVPENIQNAIYNAVSVRAADRTQTMGDFARELQSTQPVPLRNKWLKKPGLPLWGKLAIGAGAVAVAVACVIILPGLGRQRPDFSTEEGFGIQEDMARVPSVLDQPLDTAAERLSAQSLLYSIAGKEYSSEIAADLVLSQSIDGGEVIARNSMIDLIISGGAQMAAIDALEGLESQEAVQKLTDAGFVYRLEEEYSDTIAEGYVIRQSQAAGTQAAIGSEIILTISKGRDPEQEFEETLIEAPDFVGKDYQEVLQLAQEQQLIIVVKEKLYSDEYAENVVMLQSVEAGSEIMTGSTIELTVSLGVQIIRVPDLEYRTLSYARQQLDALGLRYEIRYENSDIVQKDLVISYAPGKDTQVSEGDTVSLVISLGAAQVPTQSQTTTPNVTETVQTLFPIPNVTGISEAQAKASLTNQGFTVGTVTNEYSNTVPAGNVISQNPPANEQREKGTAVSLTVSKGKEIIEPTGISFVQSPASMMYVGDTAQLSVKITPDNATDKSVTYRSSEPSVIRVSADGKIEALKGGTASITATASNGKSVSVTISVMESTLVLSAKTVTMPKNKQFELKFESSLAASEIGWRVADSSVLCFDRNDSNSSIIIKPLRAGQTTIFAELPNGMQQKCTVMISEPLTVQLKTTDATVYIGDTHQLDYDINGSDDLYYTDQSGKIVGSINSNVELLFESDTPDVASITDDGLVTAAASGYATISLYLNGFDTGQKCYIEVP